MEGKDRNEINLLSKDGVLYPKIGIWIINRNTLKKKRTSCMDNFKGIRIFVAM